jgi:DNA-binding Xre family transcriptional regulator
MTPEQFKMAKAALGLSNPELSEMTGLHRNTLNKLDKGEGKASTIQHVRLALEANGVQFLEEGQVAAGRGVAMGESQSRDNSGED